MIPETIKRPLRAWIWRKLALSWTLGTGVKIEVKSLGDWYIYNELFVSGEYDVPLHRMIDDGAGSDAPPAVVLDLGANVGFFFLRWLHLWRAAGSPGKPPKFFLIEGCGRTFVELKRRLNGQPSMGVDVTILNNLVGPREGSATITDSHNHFGNRVVGEQENGTCVSYVDLVALCGDVPAVSLLKCDIEGSEQIFLSSNAELLNKTQSLAIELHHRECDTSECVRLLEGAGLTQNKILRETDEFSVRYFRR